MPSRLPSPRRWICCVALLCLAAPAALRAQEKYTIKLDAKPGQELRFDNSMEMKMTIQSSAGGQQLPEQQQQAVQRREGTLVVEEVRDGVPSAVTVHFGKESASRATQNGQTQNQPFPLAGQTVKIKRSADGQITHDAKGELAPDVAEELQQMLEYDTSMYPDKPVAVGDEWVPDATSFRKQFQLAEDDKLDIKCKLLAVGNVDGKKTYDISVAGNVNKMEQGMPVTVQLAGVMQVESDTGLPLNTDVVAKINTKGNQVVPGPGGQPVQVNVNADGEMKIASKVRLAGGGKEVVDGGEEKPAPNPDPNPLKPVMPANAGSPFAGAFKGNDLSADFAVDGNNATGNIKLGDKTFPAAGKIENGKLTGAFEAGGAKFDFVATVDGDTMTLDSEGNKYVMKKEAAAKPANPLGQ